ncbi:hypothetical protein [Treponema sp.]|uniref:hypothetical protein n=1 Tax=Treponema sp. TaxID=166 RepID=UPI0025F34548|nr:hypothetical protein [Treponema sp.]MCR5218581.1 hypothetical protein [Treponema sp.]
MKNHISINSIILALMSCTTLVFSSCAEPETETGTETEKAELKKAELPETEGENLFANRIYEGNNTRFVFDEESVLMYSNRSDNENVDDWQPAIRYNYSWNNSKNQLYMAGCGYFEEGQEFTNPEDYFHYCLGLYTSLFGSLEVPDSAQEYIKGITEKDFSNYITFEYTFEGENLNLSYVPSCKFRTSKSDNYYGSDQYFTYNLYGHHFSFTSKESLKEYILIPEFEETHFKGTLLDKSSYLPEGMVEGKYSTIVLSSEGRFKEGYTTFTFTEAPEVMKDIVNKKIKLNFYCDKNFSLTRIAE